MKVITEAVLRSELAGKSDVGVYRVCGDAIVTAPARDYLREQHIELIIDSSCRAETGPDFVDAITGKPLAKKPERMTHLRGRQLVNKTDKRIMLRGRLDSLQSEIILWQVVATQQGFTQLTAELNQLLLVVREILSAAYSGKPYADFTLCGMSSQQLHDVSHHVKEHFGFSHPLPDYRLGMLAAGLNRLRTTVREVELAAEQAYAESNERDDLLLVLNRLSSGVYVMFCRMVAGVYGKEAGCGYSPD